MTQDKKPSVMIGMPCYDSVKVSTMVSIIKLIQQLAKSGVAVGIQTMKSPLIHQARNYLSSVFLDSDFTHLLFIDSDVEFEPEAILRMLVAKKDIICTPYRVKSMDVEKKIYTVEIKKAIRMEAGEIIEITAGPTGIMLIHRDVFKKIIEKFPELKIKNSVFPQPGPDHKYYYNFFDFTFKDGYAAGEDVSFCKLVQKLGFKLYANTASFTKHHGSYAWGGRFKDALEPKI
jgi:hypothetical protein